MHEYLNQKDYRYEETVKRHDFSGKNVVDLCSGNTGLYELVKDQVASYRACDLHKLHPIIEQTDDWVFSQSVERCDVLVCFGFGGYEITNESVESKTSTKSFQYLLEKFSPDFAVMEGVKRFRPILESVRTDGYEKEYFFTDSDWWLDDRLIIFLRKKNA